MTIKNRVAKPPETCFEETPSNSPTQELVPSVKISHQPQDAGELVLKTFRNETPETSDVVLCAHCGETLYAPEDDVNEMQTGHECIGMYKAALGVARAEIAEMKMQHLADLGQMQELMEDTHKSAGATALGKAMEALEESPDLHTARAAVAALVLGTDLADWQLSRDLHMQLKGQAEGWDGAAKFVESAMRSDPDTGETWELTDTELAGLAKYGIRAVAEKFKSATPSTVSQIEEAVRRDCAREARMAMTKNPLIDELSCSLIAALITEGGKA